jgi:hypothetical protein
VSSVHFPSASYSQHIMHGPPILNSHWKMVKCRTERVTPLFQSHVWQRPILNSHWKIRPCIKSHLVSYAMRSELGKKSSEEQIEELGSEEDRLY